MPQQQRVYALPGDKDLDFDIEGILITGILSVEDNEYILTASGGSGKWRSDETQEIEEITEVDDIDIWLKLFPEAGSQVVTDMKTKLEHWKNDKIALHMVGAPGKWFLLIENEDSVIPIPRNSQEDFDE